MNIRILREQALMEIKQPMPRQLERWQTREDYSCDMKGKICMVTGASSGIGRATALGLARLGATTVIVCRDQAKGEEVLDDIMRLSRNQSVSLMVADLASEESIRKLASGFKREYSTLHVLVNNAGTYSTRHRVTVDGIEMTFAVNYLSRFLLTNLLLDILKKSAPALSSMLQAPITGGET